MHDVDFSSEFVDIENKTAVFERCDYSIDYNAGNIFMEFDGTMNR